MTKFEESIFETVKEKLATEYAKQENSIQELQDIIIGSLDSFPDEQKKLKLYYESY